MIPPPLPLAGKQDEGDEQEEEDERIKLIKTDDLVSPAEVLNTHGLLQILMSYSLYMHVQEVDLTHGRLKVVPEVFGRLTKVEILTMRQNLIKDIGPIAELGTLRELDLYDNELTATPDLSKMNALV